MHMLSSQSLRGGPIKHEVDGMILNELILSYCTAKKFLWNNHFKGLVDSIYSCGSLDQFEEIDFNLLKGLVCCPAEIELPSSFINGVTPIYGIQVAPKAHEQKIRLAVSDPISDINRSWNKSQVFDAYGIQLAFIEIFDWDKYGEISCSLARCKIVIFEQEPSYAGREVLIECDFASFEKSNT